MTLALYNIWLQEAATARAENAIRADIRSAGLLETGGTVAERIAAEEIDLTVTGQFRLGERLAKKHAEELTSLSKSDYSTLPLFDLANADDPRRGYYELASADARPAHATTTATYAYTAALNESGSHETHWRRTATNVETIGTGIAATGTAHVAIDANATKVRWFAFDQGTEAATVTGTVNAEFGDLDQYDVSEPSFANPMLLYEADFDREWRGDCLVYDDRGETSREWTFSRGGDTATATQWQHVYHTGYEYDGAPIVENGLLRVRFDEPDGVIEAWQWNEGTGSWDSVTITHGDYELFDADLTRIGPSDVRVFTEWTDTISGDIDAALLSLQRGNDELVVRIPEGESSVPAALETVLDPIASDQADDPIPRQGLIRRSDVKGA